MNTLGQGLALGLERPSVRYQPLQALCKFVKLRGAYEWTELSHEMLEYDQRFGWRRETIPELPFPRWWQPPEQEGFNLSEWVAMRSLDQVRRRNRHRRQPS